MFQANFCYSYIHLWLFKYKYFTLSSKCIDKTGFVSIKTIVLLVGRLENSKITSFHRLVLRQNVTSKFRDLKFNAMFANIFFV
jgi:hypothetical protein